MQNSNTVPVVPAAGSRQRTLASTLVAWAIACSLAACGGGSATSTESEETAPTVVLPMASASCSDGLDNDDDSLVDASDPSCKAGRAEAADVEACAADTQAGARCLYVAPNGSDAAAGTLEAPFQTFHAAIERAGPGDFVYARGGTYGLNNAVIASMTRLPQGDFPTPCAAGLVEADNFCQVPRWSFVSLTAWNGYPGRYPDAYTVASGEAGRPITLRNFPGEVPVLDMAPLLQRGEAVEARSRRPMHNPSRSRWAGPIG